MKAPTHYRLVHAASPRHLSPPCPALFTDISRRGCTVTHTENYDYLARRRISVLSALVRLFFYALVNIGISIQTNKGVTKTLLLLPSLHARYPRKRRRKYIRFHLLTHTDDICMLVHVGMQSRIQKVNILERDAFPIFYFIQQLSSRRNAMRDRLLSANK